MRKGMFLLVLCLAITAGCGGDKPKYTPEELAAIPQPPRDNLPACSGGMVLAVGEETITASEIIKPMAEHLGNFAKKTDIGEFKEKASPQVENFLTSKITNILLYQEAKRQSPEQIDETLEKFAEAETRKFLVSFNNDYAKAEQELKEMQMDWESFKEFHKKTILSQSYVSSQLPKQKPITHNELIEEYERMKDKHFVMKAKIKFRLIDIQPAKLKVTDPNKTVLQQANDLAKELMARIQKDEDFGQLAKQYSNGHRKEFGGLWKSVNPDSLAEPFDILGDKAETMQIGQVEGPIETDEHIFIMKLEEKQAQSVKPFEEVQKQIEAKINIERQKKMFDDFGKKLVEKAVLTNMHSFIDYCVVKIYQESNR
ncbi:MAG: peptidylprolyl isomerase [Planctomycetota bacterium]|jgi:parvulin-like peptidyl-prolyl isomerase